MVEVTDSDKEASADFAHAIGLDAQEFCANADIIVQAFATHREAAAKAERDRLREPDVFLLAAVRQAIKEFETPTGILKAVANALEKQND